MFDIGFFRGQPTEYVVKYRSGRVAREGMGLAFYYLKHRTQIVAVPTSSADASFVFNELTTNFQAVTIQGQCAYRIADPRRAAALLNYALDPRKRAYLSGDPERLPQRVTTIIHMATRRAAQGRTLEETLRGSQDIAAAVLARVREEGLLAPLGVELLSVYFVSAKPTPDVARALEAEYRETLLRKADEAVYARRAAAVEEERTIKENELNTDIALEQQRQGLIDLAGRNARQEAEYRGQALEREAASRTAALEGELAAYRAVEPRTLVAVGLRELGRNAARINNLTIAPDLLATLLDARATGGDQ